MDSSPVLRQVKDRATILLLEDDRELRETLAELLEEQDFSVLAYGRGEDAVQGAEYVQVDLLVTDIRMDGMDGLEAILSLRQIHPTLETLVISGYASESETLRALQLRVGAYLKKPFAANTFLQTVNELLVRQRELEQVHQQRAAYRSAFTWSMNLTQAFCLELDYLEDHGSLLRVLDFVEHWSRAAGMAPLEAEQMRWKLLLRSLASHGRHRQLFAVYPQDAGPVVEFLYQPLGAQSDGFAEEIFQTGYVLWQQTKDRKDWQWSEVAANLTISPELETSFQRTQKESQGAAIRSNYQPSFGSGRRSGLVLAMALESAGQFDLAALAFQQVLERADEAVDLSQACLGLLRIGLLKGDSKLSETSLATLQEQLPRLGFGQTADFSYRVAASCLHLRPDLALQWVELAMQANKLARDLTLQSAVVLLHHRLQGGYPPDTLQSCAHHLLSHQTQQIFQQPGWLLEEVLKATSADHKRLHGLICECAPTIASLLTKKRLRPEAQAKLIACSHELNQRPLPSVVLEALEQHSEVDTIRSSAAQLLSRVAAGPVTVSLRLVSLGLLQVWVGSRRQANHEWRTEKVRFLLAYLAIAGSKGVSEDRLIEDFWPDLGDRGKRNLYVAVSELRKSLRLAGNFRDQEFVVRDRNTLKLSPDLSLWHDVAEVQHQFGMLSLDSLEHRYQAAKNAVSLCGGGYLEDCYQEWALVRRAELHELMSAGLIQAGKVLLEAKDYHQALSCSSKLTLLDAGLIGGYELRMRAWLGLGQPDEVVKHYERAEKTLHREFGIEPSLAMVEVLQRARYGL